MKQYFWTFLARSGQIEGRRFVREQAIRRAERVGLIVGSMVVGLYVGWLIWG